MGKLAITAVTFAAQCADVCSDASSGDRCTVVEPNGMVRPAPKNPLNQAK
jgi:hypothetical protein